MGLMLFLDMFGILVGAVLFPGLASFMPTDGAGAVKTFLTNPIVGSVIGFIIMSAILVRLFWDDGKKHAAYEEWSWENILIILGLMLMAAFVPSIFRESFKESATMTVFYNAFYYPLSWLCDGVGTGLTKTYEDNVRTGLGLPYTVAVLVGNGVQLGACFAAYVVSYRLYVIKHPVILRAAKEEDEEEETELPEEE